MELKEQYIASDEAMRRVEELRKRIEQLRPDDCPFCGGYHRIRVTRSGHPVPQNSCCSDMMREVLRLERDAFGGD